MRSDAVRHFFKVGGYGTLIVLALIVVVAHLSNAYSVRMDRTDFQRELTARIAPHGYRLVEMKTETPNLRNLPIEERMRLTIRGMLAPENEQRFALRFTISNGTNAASLITHGVNTEVFSVQIECPTSDSRRNNEISLPGE